MDCTPPRLGSHTLAQAELEGTSGEFIDRIFAADPVSALRAAPPADRSDAIGRALRGGYPEAVARARPDRIDAWCRNNVTEVVQREVADLAAIEGLLDMPRLLRLIAHRNTGLLNTAHLARDVDLPPQTTRRYLPLLVETSLVALVPTWTRSSRKRLVKSPKVIITDSDLAAHLAGHFGASRVIAGARRAGRPLTSGSCCTRAARSSRSASGVGWCRSPPCGPRRSLRQEGPHYQVPFI